MVKEGDLLAEIDPRPFEVELKKAEGNMAKNRAALRNAKLDLDRYKNLFEQGATSSQQLDTHSAQVDQLEAALMSDEGSVESSHLNLSYCRITAPIAGRAGLRNADPGNVITANDPNGIVVITPLSPIHVVFSISEASDSIGKILNKEDGHKLVVEAWDRHSTTKLANGRLWAIDNQVDIATGTLKIKALFENRNSSLFPNQFVNVKLFVDTLQNVILVPSAAIQRGPQGDYVYVVKEDSTVELRVVDILAARGDTTALKAGLEAGETVVTEGIERLRPGARVTIPANEQHQGETQGQPSGTGQGQGRGQRQGREGS
jgi:multidrug efflux system membrane fusion protein